MNETSLLKGRRILVVEDDYIIASDLADALRQRGAVVLGPVPSVDAALSLVGAGTAMDAAVLDVNLRGETAFPVAEALVKRNIPFIFATGYDKDTIPARYAHVSRYEKPLNLGRAASDLFS